MFCLVHIYLPVKGYTHRRATAFTTRRARVFADPFVAGPLLPDEFSSQTALVSVWTRTSGPVDSSGAGVVDGALFACLVVAVSKANTRCCRPDAVAASGTRPWTVRVRRCCCCYDGCASGSFWRLDVDHKRPSYTSCFRKRLALGALTGH